MPSDDASAQNDLSSHSITLKVLSQLPPPHSSIPFPSVPAGTSVRELKQLIQNAIPTQPAIDTQRLIYRGRVLPRDADSLIDVFGREAIQRVETHTLHLVIRGGDSPNPASSFFTTTASHDSVRRPTPQPVQHALPSQSAAHQSAVHQAVVQHHHQHQQALQQTHFANHHIPSMTFVQNQTGFTQIPGRHSPAPAASQHAAALPGQPSHQPSVLPQSPFQGHQPRALPPQAQFPNPHLRQQVLHPPLMPQAPGVHMNGYMFSDGYVSPAMAAHQAMLQQQMPQPRRNPSPANAAHSSTHSTNSRRPNMDGRSTTPSSADQQRSASNAMEAGQDRQNSTPSDDVSNPASQFPVPTPSFSQVLSPFPLPAQQIPSSTYSSVQFSGMPPFTSTQTHNNSRSHPPYPGWAGPAHAIDYLQALQNRLEMALHLCRWNYPPEGNPSRPIVVTHGLIFLRDFVALRNTAQATINGVLRNGPPLGHSVPSPQQLALLQSLNSRFRDVVQDWMSDIERIQANRTAPNEPANQNTSAVSNQSTSPSTIQNSPPAVSIADPSVAMAYILHSPTEPVAVIYSEHGCYSSTPAAMASSTQDRALQNSVLTPNSLGRASNQADPIGRQPEPIPNPGLYPLARPVGDFPRRVAEQAAEQAGGGNVIAINLTPLVQAVWLFIRVYVFIWVFLGGRGLGNRFFSWRTGLLFVICIGYWLLKVGIGAERIESIRRYWNELIGVEGAEPAAQNNGQQPTGAQHGRDQAGPAAGAGAATEQTAQLSPEQYRSQAQQPARQANTEPQADDGSLRELLRPLERTIALFLGSLYPGVGERQVAERERMRREAEERERQRAATEAQEVQNNANGNGNGSQTTALPNTGPAQGASNSEGGAASIPTNATPANNSTEQIMGKSEVSKNTSGAQGSSSSVDATLGNGEITERKDFVSGS